MSLTTEELEVYQNLREELGIDDEPCEHDFKFDHAAHYGHFDLYRCTKCPASELKYWDEK